MRTNEEWARMADHQAAALFGAAVAAPLIGLWGWAVSGWSWKVLVATLATSLVLLFMGGSLAVWADSKRDEYP